MARRRARCICRSLSLFPRRLSIGVGRGGSGQVPVISRASVLHKPLTAAGGAYNSCTRIQAVRTDDRGRSCRRRASSKRSVDQACASFPLPRHSPTQSSDVRVPKHGAPHLTQFLNFKNTRNWDGSCWVRSIFATRSAGKFLWIYCRLIEVSPKVTSA
jgi:hypothetical protein